MARAPMYHSFRRRLFADVAGGRRAAALRMASRHLVVPPNMWLHQHFNSGPTPARYLAFKHWSPRNAQGVPISWISRRLGGTQIDYADEHPKVRQAVRRRTVRHGLTPRMDEVYAAELGNCRRARHSGQIRMFRLLAIIASLVVAATASAETIADIAGYNGPDRTQRLIDGAKKEGVVSLYSSAVTDDIQQPSRRLSRKNTASRFSSGAAARRIFCAAPSPSIVAAATTSTSPRPPAPKWKACAASNCCRRFHRRCCRPDPASRGAASPVGDIAAEHFHRRVQHHADKTRGRAEELRGPHRPQWKGRLGVEADDGNWFMSIAGAMGEDKAVALFRKIVAANGICRCARVTRCCRTSSPPANCAGAHGPLRLWINELKAKGAPIDGVVLPPAVALPTGIAVFAHAPHPYAAALFMDFFLATASAFCSNAATCRPTAP